jgi:hypothetical protein
MLVYLITRLECDQYNADAGCLAIVLAAWSATWYE